MEWNCIGCFAPAVHVGRLVLNGRIIRGEEESAQEEAFLCSRCRFEQEQAEAALAPDGRLPDGRLPDGRLPDGRLPDGRPPDGRLPDGRLASEEGLAPDDRLPPDERVLAEVGPTSGEP